MTPIILSGGSGSRLWPVSRNAFPKQFSNLLDESLFIKTVKRLRPLGAPWVVTVRDLEKLTYASQKELGLDVTQAIYEPFGKNTAAAIALLCKRFEMLGKTEEIVGVFPADHLIGDEDAFRAAVKVGEPYASEGQIVTLGIRPTYPATGYGYIATEGCLARGGALKATGFREKPNEETAKQLLAQGGFFWNAGMFIFKIRAMIEMFQRHAPDIWTAMSGLKPDLSNLESVYQGVRSTSVDYAIMEKLESHVCIPCQFDWSDLGTWDSIVSALDGSSSRRSEPLEVEATGNFVFSASEKLYSFVGVRDLIVVDTPDSILITQKGETEQVKQLVEKMKSAPSEFLKKRL